MIDIPARARDADMGQSYSRRCQAAFDCPPFRATLKGSVANPEQGQERLTCLRRA